MRRLGVYGDNLPTKKSKVVKASDFLIAGMIGQFERKFAKAYLTRNMNEVIEIFGNDISSSFYGYEQASLFYQNLDGAEGKLYIKSHVGNTGSAIDATQAYVSVNDQAGSPQATLKIYAGYQTEKEYGTHGLRIGYKITNGYRFTTAANGAGTKDDTFVVLDSVAGVKVGDIMKFVATAGGGATVYKKITTIDEANKKVNFSGAFHASANMADNDVAYVIGFRLQIYEKSISGIIKEVDVELGKIYCTMEPEVSDYYVENVFSTSKFAVVEDQAVTESAIQEAFPADVSTVTFLSSGGSDGTAATTSAHWIYGNEVAFDDLPVRVIANVETTLAAVHASLETYCKNRDDNPKVIPVLAENQTKTQLEAAGAGFQRSDDVLMVIPAHWVQISDPFATSALAPYRSVPNAGAVMGAWLRTIAKKGIHYVPAVKDIPLKGIVGIVGTQFTDAQDRTDLADRGINCLEYLTGYGYLIRNFFTPSITTEFKFGNGLMMRDFIKVSCVDSLQSSENMPNSFNRIKEDRMACLIFLRKMWDSGSTGSVPKGETFGISEDVDGNPTKFEDHVEVQADVINNPTDKIALGERNIDIYFTYPTPAGSIKIGVGFILQS